MPIFEFRCNECNNEFEVLVLKKEEKIACPKCNSANITRLLSVCRTRSGGNGSTIGSSSGCASCSGGNCSSCG